MTHATAMLETHPAPSGTLPTDVLAEVLHHLEGCAQTCSMCADACKGCEDACAAALQRLGP
jgi:hypothetical protein